MFPSVTTNASGSPCPSWAGWTFMVSLPWDRPSTLHRPTSLFSRTGRVNQELARRWSQRTRSTGRPRRPRIQLLFDMAQEPVPRAIGLSLVGNRSQTVFRCL